MKYSKKWYLLRWLCGVARIVEGAAITVTLGFWNPDIALKFDSAFMTEFEKLNMPDVKLRGE